MPGRSEKSEIIMGMKDTFQNRQVARQKQISVAEILQQFPHLASYDGEIVSLSPWLQSQIKYKIDLVCCMLNVLDYHF